MITLIDPKLATYPHQEHYEQDAYRSKWRRLMFSTIILTSIVLLLVIGRLVDGPVSRLLHKGQGCDAGEYPHAQLERYVNILMILLKYLW